MKRDYISENRLYLQPNRPFSNKPTTTKIEDCSYVVTYVSPRMIWGFFFFSLLQMTREVGTADG
jgi:hypothetical protein